MALFPTTRWSLVLQARSDTGDARDALEQLCRAYRPPVLAMVRRHSRSREQAEDLTQSFFAKLLEHGSHAAADPERGRFRTFLMTAIQRFLSNASAHAHAAKRDGGSTFSFDPTISNVELKMPDAESPERVFERAWARTVLDRAMQRLQAEAAGAGKESLFAGLKEFLTDVPAPADYAATAANLGMRPNTVAVAVHRLRSRLREFVRVELAETVASEADVDEELRVLRAVLGGE